MGGIEWDGWVYDKFYGCCYVFYLCLLVWMGQNTLLELTKHKVVDGGVANWCKFQLGKLKGMLFVQEWCWVCLDNMNFSSQIEFKKITEGFASLCNCIGWIWYI